MSEYLRLENMDPKLVQMASAQTPSPVMHFICFFSKWAAKLGSIGLDWNPDTKSLHLTRKWIKQLWIVVRLICNSAMALHCIHRNCISFVNGNSNTLLVQMLYSML